MTFVLMIGVENRDRDEMAKELQKNWELVLTVGKEKLHVIVGKQILLTS